MEFDIFIEVIRIKIVDLFNGDVVEVVFKVICDDMYVCLVWIDLLDVFYILFLEFWFLDLGMYVLVEKGYYLFCMDCKNFGVDKLLIVR